MTIDIATTAAAQNANRPLLARELSQATLCELEDLQEAFEAAGRVYLGVINRPRTKRAALSIMEDESCRLDDFGDEIAAEAARRVPKDQDEAKVRANILIRYALHFEDSLTKITAIAVEALGATLD